MLTNKALYNLKDSSFQRKILVQNFKALTRSSKDGCLEFCVHVKAEYDYRFEADDRKSIFDACKFAFFKKSGKNIPVYAVPDSLKDYHTKKRDVQEG